MKKKRIDFRGLSEILSEREMRYVIGGSGDGIGSGVEPPLDYIMTEQDAALTANATNIKPCVNNGCNGPNNTWVPNRGLCCILPGGKYGIFSAYCYGIMTGVDKCSWV